MRPTTSISTRCITSTSTPMRTRLAGHGDLGGAGQGALRGEQQIRGVAIVEANEAAANRHSVGLVSEQSLYNLDARMVEFEVLPLCADYGVGVIPWSPLGGGPLGVCSPTARRVGGGVANRCRLRSGKPDQARGVGELLRNRRAAADVGSAWLLHNPVVTAPIIGPPPVGRSTRDGRARRGAHRRRAHRARPDLPGARPSCAPGVRLVAVDIATCDDLSASGETRTLVLAVPEATGPRRCAGAADQRKSAYAGPSSHRSSAQSRHVCDHAVTNPASEANASQSPEPSPQAHSR